MILIDTFANALNQDTRDYIKICLPASNDGNIIAKMAPDINVTMNTLSTVVQQISNFSSQISPYMNNVSSFSSTNAALITQYRTS